MMSVTAGYVFLAANACFLIAIGLLARWRQVAGAEDYLVAGRRVRWPLISGSIIVTWAWASTVLASGEATYNFGWPAVWMYPVSGISLALTIPLFRRIKDALPHGLTFPEFVRLRFGKEVHVLTTVVTIYILFMLLFYLMIGLGWGLQPLFGLPYWQGVLIGGSIVIVYTLLGGLWSSILTDYFQYFFVWIVTALAVGFGLVRVGGVGALYDGLQKAGIDKGLALVTPDAFINYFLIIFFSWLTYAIMEQTIWQRVYALENPRHVTRALFFGWIGWSLLPMAAGLLGLVGLQQGLKLEVASDVIPRVVAALAPSWMGVLLALMIYNAIASTLGSMLVAISSIVTVDILEPYILRGKSLGERKRLSVSTWLVVLFGVAGILVSIRPTSIMYLGFYLSGLLMAVTVPIALGLLVPRSNTRSVLVAMALGFGVAVYLSAAVNYGWITHLGGHALKLWEVYAVIMLLQVVIVGLWSGFKPGEPLTIAEVGRRSARTA